MFLFWLAVPALASNGGEMNVEQTTKPCVVKILSLDHLVLTVANIPATVDFYARILGMEKVVFGEGRVALLFGNQKINLHLAGSEVKPHAEVPTRGSADLCFVIETPVEEVAEHLRAHGVEILIGPVPRTGARGPINSIYFRDPDRNLIELSNYPS